ncbi:MAG: DUF370 domain-containing protein [Syntrophomonadaceae bacterium]|jgi:regulator of extracellular matrix RemA (YlzA/DUF370 family)|nr:DUF370 domain-containing protein [Syntrophomonadaceae bacterium]
MYVHLGNNYTVPLKEIITIVNLQNPLSENMKDIIEQARLEKKLTTVTKKGKEKSMIICDDGVILSHISSNTLFKRGLFIKGMR